MPKTSHMSCRSNPSTASDVMQASLAQLPKLLTEIFNFTSHAGTFVSTGVKAMMARQLYNAIHLIATSSTSATSKSPVTATSTSLTYTQDTVPIPSTLPCTYNSINSATIRNSIKLATSARKGRINSSVQPVLHNASSSGQVPDTLPQHR